MINLSSTNLSPLNLGGMNTSEIKLGYPSSGCPVPGLKGLQGLYMGKGLTNEMMSRDPIWRDKSGKGNHIALKNFGWKLDSGCGKYDYDFSEWSVNTSITVLARNSDKVTFKTILPSGSGGISKRIANKYQIFKINITDLAGRLEYRYWDNVSWTTVRLLNNGYHELDFFELPESALSIGFILIGGGSVTIEQIPDYDGAICFDGVNDYGICETFPVFTKEKGYTVMALRKWISRDNHFEILLSNEDVWNDKSSAFWVEYKNSDVLTSALASSFGHTSAIKLSNDSLVYQTSNKYNGSEIPVGNNISGSNILIVARSAKSKFIFYSSFALYALAIFDDDTTAEERQPVIDYWKKEFPELFPDQAWTVTGKTNSDADRATIKNITGNGNDLVLTNFAFAENSGYGKYAEDYSSVEWRLALDRAETVKNNFSFHTTSITSTVVAMYYQSYLGDDPFTVKSYNIKVSGLKDGQSVRYLTGGVVISTIDSDGIFKLPSFDFAANKAWYGFAFDKIQESCDITIEQIPDYEGYLVTDGVDDQISSGNIAFGDDWTIVGDWFFYKEENKICGVVAPSNFYIYNRLNGVTVYIKKTNPPDTLSDISTLKAVCSDGRVYDENWNEIKLDIGTIKNATPIRIGYLSEIYTPVAFKNLGVYNNAILKKEQCIRAYNYLQTIKNN